MTDGDKVMNPQHFVSYPADIRIRIQIRFFSISYIQIGE